MAKSQEERGLDLEMLIFRVQFEGRSLLHKIIRTGHDFVDWRRSDQSFQKSRETPNSAVLFSRAARVISGGPQNTDSLIRCRIPMRMSLPGVPSRKRRGLAASFKAKVAMAANRADQRELGLFCVKSWLGAYSL